MRVMHAFCWRLKDIKDNLGTIKEQGFDAIQTSPLQPTKQDGNVPWWMFYQITDFKIGNQIGSKQDLIDLCKKANKLGIRIIVDVVGNNVAGLNNGEIYPHERLKLPLNYYKPFNRVQNWEDRNDYINNSIGIPCLNTRLHEVQDLIFNYIDELISCGVKGVRMDATKHIALPSEGSDFWINFRERFSNKDLYSYGEVIFEDHRVIDEYMQYINVLTEMSHWDKNKLVTFIDSHDLHHTFNITSHMNDETAINEYRLLCQNFNNTVWYCREFNDTWKDIRVKEANLWGK